MAKIAIRCARPCWYDGRSLSADEVVNVEPLVAADLLNSGRCELVRDADRAVINEAVQHENARLVGRRDAWVRRGS